MRVDLPIIEARSHGLVLGRRLEGLLVEVVAVQATHGRVEVYESVAAVSSVILAGLGSGGFIGSAVIREPFVPGMPLGGELELVDGGTLAHSIAGRRPIQL